MPSPVFRALRIEAFRGFNQPVELNLDASVVLLRGPNGSGKTSVFDAVQWLLLGDVERLRALRERRDAEHLVNQYRRPGPASVEADVVTPEGVATVKRVGNYSGNVVTFALGGEVLEGDLAETALGRALLPTGDADVEGVLLTSGMLQQDVVRSLIEAKPTERFAALNRLLRLESLTDFQKATETAQSSAAEQAEGAREALGRMRARREGLEMERDRIRDSVLSNELVDAAVSDMRAVIQSASGVVDVTEPQPLSAQAATALAREAAATRRRLAELHAELSSFEATPAPAVELENTEQLRSEVDAALVERETVREQLSHNRAGLVAAEKTAEELAQLAALALPRLGDGVCPVCQQTIDPSDVAEHLHGIAGDVPVLESLREERTLLESQYAQAEDRLTTAQAALERGLEHNREVERYSERLEILRDAYALAVHTQRLEISPDSDDRERRTRVLAVLANLSDAAQRCAAALGSANQAGRLTSVDADWAAAQAAEREQAEVVERLARAEAEGTALVRATKGARVDVAENRFARVRPLVRELFLRLDAHRAFTELDLEPTVYGRGGATVMATTRDPERDVTVTPGLVFSSAQSNVAALAYFLALSWGAQDHALPFVMLDDPLQSMDDVNVLAFADLCRFIRERRQLFLSTHERRFADLLERKLAPRNSEHRTVVLEFSGWDREGPTILQRPLTEANAADEDVFLQRRALAQE